jgi:hypothetical protein
VGGLREFCRRGPLGSRELGDARAAGAHDEGACPAHPSAATKRRGGVFARMVPSSPPGRHERPREPSTPDANAPPLGSFH